MKILIQTISLTLILTLNLLQIAQLKAECYESNEINNKFRQLNKDFCTDEGEENILAGCSLSLDHTNVYCSNDMTGSLEVQMTTAIAGEHTFSWTYSMNSSSPLLPLPSGISNSTISLPMIPPSMPTTVASYTNLPTGYYFLTITGPDLGNGQDIFCVASGTIIFEDFEGPDIGCPAAFTVSANPGSCETLVTIPIPVPDDSCGIASITQDVLTATVEIGDNTIPVTYTVEDGSGNVTVQECDVVVTVRDLEEPTVTCPSDINIMADNAECDAVVTWGEITAEDNCGIASITATCIFPDGTTAPCASGEEYPLGTTLVLSTVTDVNGNPASCSFQITVTDNENPTANCPPNITVNADSGECGAIVTWEISANDNCDIDNVITTCLFPGGNTFEPCFSGMEYPLGTTVVQGVATDLSDNSVNCVLLITVQAGAGACNDDVFPGDCNTDGIVNTEDALYWGLAEGFNGTVRPNATTDCSPQACPDWSQSVDGINSKHQDGDGNGTIDGQDLQVIISNYDCINNYTAPTYASGTPIYRVQPQGINNGKYQYDIYVENGSGAAAVAHGLAFTVTSDVIPIAAITMSTTGSSLNPDVEFAILDGNQCHAALTRIDNYDATCAGPIATLLIQTNDVPVDTPFEINITSGAKIRANATLDNITGATAFGMYSGTGASSGNLLLDASVTHEQCNGLGGAIAIPSGGTSPYTYAWNTGASSAQVNNLASGTYTITVTDANGLNQSLTLQINGQTPIYDAGGNLLCGNLCPEYLAPSGVTGNGLYSASNALNSDATIPTGNNAEYKAGQVIELKSGFEVQPNAEFSAEIEDCQ